MASPSAFGVRRSQPLTSSSSSSGDPASSLRRAAGEQAEGGGWEGGGCTAQPRLAAARQPGAGGQEPGCVCVVLDSATNAHALAHQRVAPGEAGVVDVGGARAQARQVGIDFGGHLCRAGVGEMRVGEQAWVSCRMWFGAGARPPCMLTPRLCLPAPSHASTAHHSRTWHTVSCGKAGGAAPSGSWSTAYAGGGSARGRWAERGRGGSASGRGAGRDPEAQIRLRPILHR